MDKKRIGFVSTRLAGTDGVSLETQKWARVFEADGHECFYMAGELDTPEDRSRLVPNCHFRNKRIWDIYLGCFDRDTRAPETSSAVEGVKHELKKELSAFVAQYDLDLLIPENAMAIPFNIPLALALTEFIMETGIPVIAHHHDFFWERKRFLRNACWDYLSVAFPPNLSMMQHAVLNSSQRHQISLRRGVSATIIPNVMDFHTPPPEPDGYADDLREQLGIAPEEKLILQPTRIVQRKGIEHAIELLHRLKEPVALVISHASGDEGHEYYHRVREYSKLMGVKTIYCSDNVAENRGLLEDGRKIYTLADLYHQADLVTYPSVFGGFGNAFLEALYYRKPIVVNDYSVYSVDIKPRGFQTVELSGYVTEGAVMHAREVLHDPRISSHMVEHNHALATRFFSYDVLRQNLRALMASFFGA
ncbi:MAG: glycosyltransferase family 4 protein [Verrucomicrobia bacterium]|nr:glycosyltransferase family 4 protein [Verrucomicrobiota bacterium]